MLSNRFIVVSDLHLNIYSKYSYPDEDVNSRFHHQRLIIRKIFMLAAKKGANVVFNGDLFDSRGSIDCRVTDMAFHEILEGTKLLTGESKVILLAGNHDQVDNSRVPANSLSLFKGINSRIYVINVPSVMEVQATTTDQKKLGKAAAMNWAVFLPYSEDKKWELSRFNKLVGVLKNDNYQKRAILFGHLGVAGAKMGAHLVRLSGEFSLSDLHPDFFRYIVLGHYHHRQFLNKEHTAFYVGNTIPLRHEDDGQVKGVWDLELDKNVSKFIPLSSPMFYTFSVKGKYDSKIGHLCLGNFVRVSGTNRQLLHQYAQKGADTVYQQSKSYKPRIDIKAGSGTKDIVSTYCKKYHPELTKVALKELAKAQEKLN